MSRPRRRRVEIEKAVHHLKSRKSIIALHTISVYVDGAVSTWNKIQSDNLEATRRNVEYERDPKRFPDSHNLFWDLKYQSLFDVHFYFVCCDVVQCLMNQMVKKERAQPLDDFWKKWWPQLESFNNGRNTFEHPEGYIFGGPVWDNAYYFLTYENIKVKDEEFDISSQSLKKITDSFDELLRAIEACELQAEIPKT